MLTDEQLKALPTLRADSQVKLLGVHCHQSLGSKPITVETSEGHFRIPKVLWPVARRALEAAGDYEGAGEGLLGQVLLEVADAVPAEVPAQDGFHQLAEKLAGECFARLKDLTAEAVRKRLEHGRDVLLSEAVKGLV
jgi:hypothetical protein